MQAAQDGEPEGGVVLVWATFPDLATARQIGTALVTRQLAACVNVVPTVTSIYRWQDEDHEEDEALAIFHTSAGCYPAFEAALREAHPYDLPQILGVSADHALAAYREWVHRASHRPEPREGES